MHPLYNYLLFAYLTLNTVSTILHANQHFCTPLEGHSQGVLCMLPIINKDKEIIITGSSDGSIKVWNGKTHKCDLLLSVEQKDTYCLEQISNKEVASGHQDGTINIWNITNGKLLYTLQGHTAPVCLIKKYSRNKLVSTASDGTIKIWHLKHKECTKTFTLHDAYVITLLTLSNKEKEEGKIIAGLSTGQLKVWDIHSHECLHTIQAHQAFISCMIPLQSSSNTFASGSFDGTIKIWDAQTGACIHNFHGHTMKISSLLELPDGLIASASFDGSIKIWDLHKNKCIRTLKSSNGPILAVTSLNEKNIIVASTCQGTIEVFNPSQSVIEYVFKNYNKSVSYLAALPENRFISGDYEGLIKIWDIYHPSEQLINFITSIEQEDVRTSDIIEDLKELDRLAHLCNFDHEMVKHNFSGQLTPQLNSTDFLKKFDKLFASCMGKHGKTKQLDGGKIVYDDLSLKIMQFLLSLRTLIIEKISSIHIEERKVQAFKNFFDEDPLPLTIDRSHIKSPHALINRIESEQKNHEIQQDDLSFLSVLPDESLIPLKISFNNALEIGIDEGGPSREFITILLKNLTDNYFIQTQNDGSDLFRYGTTTFTHHNDITLRLFGRILALALAYGVPPSHLPPLTYHVLFKSNLYDRIVAIFEKNESEEDPLSHDDMVELLTLFIESQGSDTINHCANLLAFIKQWPEIQETYEHDLGLSQHDALQCLLSPYKDFFNNESLHVIAEQFRKDLDSIEASNHFDLALIINNPSFFDGRLTAYKIINALQYRRNGTELKQEAAFNKAEQRFKEGIELLIMEHALDQKWLASFMQWLTGSPALQTVTFDFKDQKKNIFCLDIHTCTKTVDVILGKKNQKVLKSPKRIKEHLKFLMDETIETFGAI